MAYVDFERAKKTADEFIELLHGLGIDVPRGSPTEDDALAITAIVEMWQDPAKRPPNLDPRPLFRAAAGFIDFGAKILAVQDHPDFHKLMDHLKESCKGSIVQNRWSSVLDAVANKMIELYLGAVIMQFATDVEVDHPVTSSNGTNPDVLFTYRKKRWTLAIKTLHSDKPQTVFDNIKKGCEQIERSTADHGMVVINLKNVIDHDALWPANTAPIPEQQALDMVNDAIDRVAIDPVGFPTSEWKDMFGSGRKAVLPVLYVAHTIFYGEPAGQKGAFPMPLKVMRTVPAISSDEAGALKVANEINHLAQSFI